MGKRFFYVNVAQTLGTIGSILLGVGYLNIVSKKYNGEGLLDGPKRKWAEFKEKRKDK